MAEDADDKAVALPPRLGAKAPCEATLSESAGCLDRDRHPTQSGSPDRVPRTRGNLALTLQTHGDAQTSQTAWC